MEDKKQKKDKSEQKSSKDKEKTSSKSTKDKEKEKDSKKDKKSSNKEMKEEPLNKNINPTALPGTQDINRFNNNRTPFLEKCEGCFETEAICFCNICQKLYCKMCEDQIHIVPSNSKHERVPITDVPHLKKHCYHHNLPLKLYCESCEEPICHECNLIGPHSNKLHRVTNLFDSFKRKFNYLNDLIHKHLLFKLDELTNQMQILEYSVEEAKRQKKLIERDIREEYSSLLENLTNEEGKKLAVLQYDSSILQKDVNKIHDIIGFMNEIQAKDNPDIIQFLLKFKQINENVEFSLTKPFKKSIDVKVNDYPRELDSKRQKLENYEKALNLIKMKDELICKLLSQMEINEDKLIEEFKERTHNEISEWVKLADKYTNELKKYDLMCLFCGNYLDKNSVNSFCSKNSPENQNALKNSTKSANIPIDFFGSKRHFFNYAQEDIKNEETIGINSALKKGFNSFVSSISTNTNINNINNENSKSLSVSSQVINEDEIMKIFQKMKEISEKFKFTIEDALYKNFHDKDTINIELLRVFLLSKFDLTEIETQKLMVFLCNGGDSNNPLSKQPLNLNTTINLGSLILLIKKSQTNLNKSSIINESNSTNIYNNRSSYNNERTPFGMGSSSSSRSRGASPYYSNYDEHKNDGNSNDWVLKTAAIINQKNINLSDELSLFDTDHDGFITPDDLKLALTKLKTNITNSDFDNMLKYFNLSNADKINFKDFSKNFNKI